MSTSIPSTRRTDAPSPSQPASNWRNPNLNVIVIMGDGDATAIGGNHFIHAARRNLNLTAIVVNNNMYGMTGGQYSPTTPLRSAGHHRPVRKCRTCLLDSRTGRYGRGGDGFQGNGLSRHILDELFEKAILKRGFAVVEAISHCHTQYGRRNRMGDAVEMLKWQKESSVRVEKAKTMSEEELKGKFTIGMLVDRDLPAYTQEYRKVREARRRWRKAAGTRRKAGNRWRGSDDG